MNYKLRNQTKLIASFLLLGCLVIGLNACTRHEDKQVTVETKPMVKTADSNKYKTVPILFQNPDYEISLPGNLEPYESVAIYAKVKGFVQKLYVDRGDRVRKGQLLAILEAPELDQSYVAAKSDQQKIYADYQFAQQSYDRLKMASKTPGAVAVIELERAKSMLESAQSAFQASKAQTGQSAQMKNYLRITAPFNGVVTDRLISVGALVGIGPGQELFRIAQEDHLRLTVSVPEKQAASIQEDLEADFTVTSQPGKIFKATLSRNSGLINSISHAITLEFDFDNTAHELNGGEYAQVKLNLKRSYPTFWVNNKSVLNTQSGTFVLVMENKNIRWVAVQEGAQLNENTEIFGNLQEGDQIIVKPNEEMKEGQI